MLYVLYSIRAEKGNEILMIGDLRFRVQGSKGSKGSGGGFAAKKEANPRLAALGSPFQGKGLAWMLPPSFGRRCPEGAEVGWG